MQTKYINIIFGLNCILFSVICLIIHYLKNIKFYFLFDVFVLFNYSLQYLFGSANYYIFVFLFILIGCLLVFLDSKLIKKFFILNLFNLWLLFILELFYGCYNEKEELFGFVGSTLINSLNRIDFKLRLFFFIFAILIYFIFVFKIIKKYFFKTKNNVKLDIIDVDDNKDFQDDISEKVDFWRFIDL